MASRLAKNAVGAARLRPTLPVRLPALTTPITQQHRFASNVPSEDPKKKAQSIIDALPGNTLVSKTAILSATAGLSVAAISQELFVVNEEAVVGFCLLTVFYGIYKYAGPMYKEWADGQIQKQREILNQARTNHTQAVQKRIDEVKQLDGVVDVTKQLFEVSKETAQLEAQAYELEQKTALAAEAKSVLDSWVRYEGQVKVREQRELADSIIGKIQKELENPRVLQQILQQSVADVEISSRTDATLAFTSILAAFTILSPAHRVAIAASIFPISTVPGLTLQHVHPLTAVLVARPIFRAAGGSARASIVLSSSTVARRCARDVPPFTAILVAFSVCLAAGAGAAASNVFPGGAETRALDAIWDVKSFAAVLIAMAVKRFAVV
ncbi:MAG: hypothetical protein Q9227_003596 [Pyrenula ochraceoflavens]